MKSRLYIVLGAAFAVSACAGRAPAPVAVTQAQDRYLDCAAINVEVQANNKKVAELGGEEGAKVAQNVVAGVAGLIIWPLWFAMDFQGAAPKEIAALQARQQYLATLAEQRCGAVPPLAIQTVPMPASATAAPYVAPVSAAPSQVPAPVPAPSSGSSLDDLWIIELKSGSGMDRCPNDYKIPVTFTNRIAEGPWGRLRMTEDGEMTGWLVTGGDVGFQTRTGQPANLNGRLVNGVVSGGTSGGCAGAFTMSRSAPASAAPAPMAPMPVAPVAPVSSTAPAPVNNVPVTPQGPELSCINPDGSFLRTTAPNCPPPSQPLKL